MENAPTRIGIAVVEFDGRYLVGVRSPERPLAGCAEFPGGKCRPAESPADCARRECLEETGLQVTAERLLLRRTFEYSHGAVDLHFWLCRPVRAESVADEHREFRWVAGGALASLTFPEANAPLIDMLVGESGLH